MNIDQTKATSNEQSGFRFSRPSWTSILSRFCIRIRNSDCNSIRFSCCYFDRDSWMFVNRFNLTLECLKCFRFVWFNDLMYFELAYIDYDWYCYLDLFDFGSIGCILLWYMLPRFSIWLFISEVGRNVVFVYYSVSRRYCISQPD